MIETENESNNNQCLFDDSMLNLLNQSKIDNQKLLDLTINTLSCLETLNSLYEQVFVAHENFTFLMKDLGIDSFEKKVFIVVLIRQTRLIAKLIKLQESSLLENSEERKRLESSIAKLYSDSPEKIEELILEECKSFIEIGKKLNSLPENMLKCIKTYSISEALFIKNMTFCHKPSKRLLAYFYTYLEATVTIAIYRLRFFLYHPKFESLVDINEEKMLFDLMINLNKLVVLSDLLFKIFSKEGTCMLENLSHVDWDIIKPSYKYYMIKTNRHIKESLSKIYNLLIVGVASFQKTYELENDHIPFLKNSLYMAYYFANPRKAKHSFKKFQINQDFNIGRHMWGINELFALKDIGKLNLPMVYYRNRYFIPISDGFNEKELNQLVLDYMNAEVSNDKSTHSDHSLKSNDRNTHISLKFLGTKKGSSHISAEYFELSSNAEHLIKNKPEIATSGDIIIHIHGGGFVSMSSTSHECYLRKWVNNTNIPIISIDYSLAPKYPYPVALNEIYQAYLFIVENRGIKIKNIILAGDSAGGNFIVALTSLLIVNNKRVPDLLIASYPALYLSTSIITPSTLLSLDDMILSSPLLFYSLQSYLGSKNSEDHCFSSPGNMPDKILEHFPQVNFYLGSTDPLRDQTFYFASRLL